MESAGARSRSESTQRRFWVGFGTAALCWLAAPGCRVLPVEGNRDTRGAASEIDDVADRETAKFLPLGRAGGGPGPGLDEGDLDRDAVPVTDRWRVGFPAWDRGSKSDSPYDPGAWYDPFHQNLLKGDYPLPGTQNTFLVAEATATVLAEARRTPTPSGVFPSGGGGVGFFRNGDQWAFDERLNLSLDLFHGETSFKPVDWRVFVRGVFDENQTRAQENTVLFADPARGRSRDDRFAALQEAFFETTLATVSPWYDVVQARLGTQHFNADFRGFLLLDDVTGLRLFGNLDDDRWQWNAALFRRQDKDTNSGLNRLSGDRQNVWVLDVYRQDLLEGFAPAGTERPWSKGLTGEAIWLRYWDGNDVSYDSNGNLVRPRPVGSVLPNHRTVDYLGWNMDGHVGRVNVTASLYHAMGRGSFDEIAGQAVTVDANMAALELSLDRDWMRWKVFGFLQSGDRDPLDGKAEGFDAVFDNPSFAGGEFGFWNRNGIRLTGTGIGLVQPRSLLNSFRSSKDEGAPSYVNPGLLLFGAGWDGQITPNLKVVANASYLLFDQTAPLERVLNQSAIGKGIGWDLSAGVIWRPLLTENMTVKGGVAALIPGQGYRDIYTGEVPYSVFVEVSLKW